MADSFMIQFTCEGKPCFANVYAYDTTPREYHVHIVNTHFFSSLPEHIVLIEQNEKLCLKQADGAMLRVPSLAELVGARAPEVAKKTTQQIQNSVAAASAIQAPFDREIIGGANVPGPQRVKASVDSLVEQSTLLVESANAIGITQLTLTLP